MIVVLPFSARDHQLARKLAKWIDFLGPYPGHRAVVVKDTRIDDNHEVAQTLRGCFDAVQEVPYPDDNRNEWPFSANRMFNRAAKEIEYSAQPESWLWLEPDAVPLRKGWLDELVSEYKLAKKPFMGDEVNVNGVPLHMSGVGIYPALISQHAWEAPLAQDTAWDVAAAHQIVPRAHFTERIVHAWRHEPIDTVSKLINLRGQHPKMVLFHSDKSGTMIDLLRNELGDEDIHISGGTDSAAYQNEAVQKGFQSSPSRAGQSHISPLSSQTSTARTSEGTGRGSGQGRSSEGRHPETGPVLEMRETDAAGNVVRSSHGLYKTASGGMAMQSMPLEPSQRSVKELLPSVPDDRPVESSGTDRVGDTEEAEDEVLLGGSGARQPVNGPIGPVDLFIKTYPEDFGWLTYCLRSIDKFADGFGKVVVVSPVPIPYVDTFIEQKLIEAGEQSDGYLWQQVIKLYADKFTDAEHIAYVDSDTIFVRPVRPEMFFRNGRPIWMITPYSEIDVPWKPIIEKFLGQPVEYEFMRRFPAVIPRWLPTEVRKFCKAMHGVELDQYVLSQPKSAFSEFNALGAFAYTFHREKFEWISTSLTPPERWPVLTVKQAWSKGGLTEAIKKDYNEILSGGQAEMAKAVPHNTQAGPSPTISFPERSQEIASSLVCGQKNSDEGGGPSSNSIRQTKEGFWVLEGDNYISKWVEEEHRLDHDQWLLARILQLVKPGDVVIEAGAYIGDHTTAFLKHGCKVIAYEPNPQAAECLRRNCPEAEVIEMALWHETAQLEFEKIEAQNPGASWVVEHFGGRPVQSVSLDGRPFSRVDLIMIDVEGSELFVLQGAERTIKKHRPKLVIELNAGAMKRYGYSEREIREWLSEHGYTWEPIQPLQVADPPQYDIFAWPRAVHPAQPARPKGRPSNGEPPSTEIVEAIAMLKEFADRDVSSRMKIMYRLSRAGLVPRYPNQKRKRRKNREKEITA